MATERYRVEFEGTTLRCDIDTESADLYVWVRLPSGGHLSLSHEAGDAPEMGAVYSAEVRTPEDWALHGRLTAVVDDGCCAIPRPRPDLIGAVRAAGPAVVAVALPEPTAPRRQLDQAETLAMLDLEGTPMAPMSRLARPDRTCVECGSPVYGDHCTHCMEG